MTIPENLEQHRFTSDAADAAARLLERLTHGLGGRASVEAVFGEPITHDGVTVVPVASVGYGFGGGAGSDSGVEKLAGGGGGGGGVGARPLGYIEITGGTTRYRPIHSHWIDLLIPLTAILAASGVKAAVRAALARRGRRR
ncbi:spore germination protein GerW family protein [Nocardia sp. IFM 10818]